MQLDPSRYIIMGLPNELIVNLVTSHASNESEIKVAQKSRALFLVHNHPSRVHSQSHPSGL